ncbi:hypothetical protein GCM10008934_01360 [Virgibacillus salarius]
MLSRKLFLVSITALALLMAFIYYVSASLKSAEESLKDSLNSLREGDFDSYINSVVDDRFESK